MPRKVLGEEGEERWVCCHGENCPERCERCGLHVGRTLAPGEVCATCDRERARVVAA